MSEPATAAVTEAPAAPADPDAPLPPLDHDTEVGQQIKQAQENVARAERRKAKAEKTKGKAAAKAAPPPPKTEEPDGKTDPAPPPAEEESEPAAELTAPSAALLVKARQLAESGDIDGAIKLALGKDAAAFRINSARWTEWHKQTAKVRKEIAQRETEIRNAVQQLSDDYGPLVEARKLFAAEDYEGAFQKAFGLDLNSFQKKALAKYHGKNPEVEAVRKELQELREERAKLQREQEQQALQVQEQAQHRANTEAIATHLGGSNDEQLAALAKKPRFIRQVYNEFLQRVEHGEPPSMLLVAACAEEIRDGLLGEFGDVFVPRGQSESGGPRRDGTNPGGPRQVGKEPGRPGAAAAAPSTLSQRGASEASSPGGPELSDEELFRKYTDKMKHAS